MLQPPYRDGEIKEYIDSNNTMIVHCSGNQRL
jgi:hypothetical protein